MERHPVGHLPDVSVLQVRELWFGSRDPVRAASAVARLGDGWLVAQDDAVHGGWWQEPFEDLERVRLLPPVRGREVFSEATATKHLKPDLEAACPVPVDGGSGVLLLGSGSLPNRTHGVLADLRDGEVRVRSRDLAPLYHRVATTLGLDAHQLNLEGACMVGDRLRWFQRGHGRSGVPSASVDVDGSAVVAAVTGGIEPGQLHLGRVRRYDLGTLEEWPLAITDAVTLPGGGVCVSATAEDSPDPVADGPVAGSVLALIDDEDVLVVPLPREVAGHKVEGLAVARTGGASVELLAVVDQDDPLAASTALVLEMRRHANPAT